MSQVHFQLLRVSYFQVYMLYVCVSPTAEDEEAAAAAAIADAQAREIAAFTGGTSAIAEEHSSHGEHQDQGMTDSAQAFGQAGIGYIHMSTYNYTEQAGNLRTNYAPAD